MLRIIEISRYLISNHVINNMIKNARQSNKNDHN